MVAILISALVMLIATAAGATLVDSVRQAHHAVHAIARQLAELEEPRQVIHRPRPVRAAVGRRPVRPASAALRAAA